MECSSNSECGIDIVPVGEVVSDVDHPMDMPVAGRRGVIRVKPEYAPALHLIEENSHLWIQCWFHRARRDILRTAPLMVNPDLPERGVFGLRAAARPNPIALTLVRLLKVDGTLLHVAGLDAVAGTPVLDIKPYYEADIVFSPRTPYIPPKAQEMRHESFMKQAIQHHQESCAWVEVGVRMALVVEEAFGQIQSPDLFVSVRGPRCLADVVQGLSRARLANPPRFTYVERREPVEVEWSKGGEAVIFRLKTDYAPGAVQAASDSELFEVNRARPAGTAAGGGRGVGVKEPWGDGHTGGRG